MTKQNQPARKLPPDEVIVADLARGLSYGEMAASYGVNAETVRSCVRRNGWTRGSINEIPRLVQPSAWTIVNERGHSLPRIPTLHGVFREVTA